MSVNNCRETYVSHLTLYRLSYIEYVNIQSVSRSEHTPYPL
jgi:hypothetical protein